MIETEGSGLLATACIVFDAERCHLLKPRNDLSERYCVLQFVVDWIARQWDSAPTVAVEANDTFSPVAAEAGLTRSQQGIRFQRDEFGRLFTAIGHWDSIEFLTAYGSPVESVDDMPVGSDGGIDGVIRITATTERGAKIVAGRIRAMIVHQAY